MLLVEESNIEWLAANPRPPLKSAEIHLWWACLQVDARKRRELESTLSARERDRAARLRIDRQRERYIAGRGIARELLSHYIGGSPATIRFAIGPYGKPSLPNRVDGKQICFNYTDSQGMALYAFARDCELGIDLEGLARKIQYQRIATRKFTRREAETLLSISDPQGKQAFLACWTRKEAYGKAKGFGICYPLDSVELCSDQHSSAMIIADDALGEHGGYWTLQQLHPSSDFVAAIVYAGAKRELRYFSF